VPGGCVAAPIDSTSSGGLHLLRWNRRSSLSLPQARILYSNGARIHTLWLSIGTSLEPGWVILGIPMVAFLIVYIFSAPVENPFGCWAR
jgi:hypothetical protein